MGLPCGFMRVLRRVGAAAVAVAFAALLCGCAPQIPPPPPKSSPSSSPVFASDEEALAAATKAYAAYLKVSDQIAQDGGVEPARIAEYVTSDWLPNEIADFDELAHSGRRQVGFTKFDGMKLQEVVQRSAKSASVRAYACLDLSEAKLEDASGKNVTPSDLDLRASFEVNFLSSAPDPSVLVLAGSEPWSGTDIC